MLPPLQNTAVDYRKLFVALDSGDEVLGHIGGVLGIQPGAAVQPGLLVGAGGDGDAVLDELRLDALLILGGLGLEPGAGFLHAVGDDGLLLRGELLPDGLGNQDDGGADDVLGLVDVLGLLIPVVVQHAGIGVLAAVEDAGGEAGVDLSHGERGGAGPAVDHVDLDVGGLGTDLQRLEIGQGVAGDLGQHVPGGGADVVVQGADGAAGLLQDLIAQGTAVVAVEEVEAALDALDERVKVWDKYACPTPEGANWDWFKTYWEEGTSAFYAGQTWQGFNDGAEMDDMQDEWGAVMVPKGPNAETYKAMACDNIYGIPNVYSPEVSEKIQMIYDLYTDDVPGTDSEDNWIGNKYNKTDERAVDETYAMMREPEHSAPNYTFNLGSTNDVLGSALLWGPINSKGPAQAVEESKGFWQDLMDVFNGVKTQEEVDAENAAEEAAAAAAAAEAAEEAPAAE